MCPLFNLRLWCLTPLFLLLLWMPSQAKTLAVHCNRTSGLSSINAALRLLNPDVSNTLIVSGTCTENVLVFGFNRLNMIAQPRAAIQDGSGGSGFVVQIEDSKDVTLKGFTIRGGQIGVFCVNFSVCRFVDNKIQDATGPGVQVVYSRATFDGHNILQHNFFGVTSLVTSFVALNPGTVIRENASSGIVIDTGGSIAGTNIMVQNNAIAVTVSSGIESVTDGHVSLGGSTISGNAGFGITLLGQSVAEFSQGNHITGNPAGGVTVGDQSYALFNPGNDITGNTNGDVVCFPQFSATRGALTNIGGGTTNCGEPSESQKTIGSSR